jgi:hypothetical protein
MKQYIDAPKSGILYFLLLLFVSLNSFSQIPQNNTGGGMGIGTSTPNPSALLELSSPSKGFLPPRMTVIERDSISNPAEGLMIFNTSSGCPNYYYGGSWHEWCGTRVLPLATLSGLNCNSVIVTGNLLMGTPASGVSCTISYSGGNGGVFASQAISSTGVSGLTANLISDTLANGSGTLECTITGTPDNSGNASFQISIGSLACSISVNVGLPAPAILYSSPASPSNTSTTPTLTISGPANKTIQVFNNSTGTGSPAFSAIANVNVGGVYYALIPVIVTSNSSTTFTAKAVDGIGNTSSISNSLIYVHDNVSPSAPTITSSTPISPSRTSTTPNINLTGEVGSTINIYSGSGCTGSFIGSGVVSAGGAASITVTVTSNAATVLTATATDAAGNVSSCSNTFTYIHDVMAPSSPVFISSSPSSPSKTSTTPTITLSGESGSIIRIYAGSSCAGSVLSSGVVSGGSAAVTVTANSNSTTFFTATAIDAAGNLSACSPSFSYTHDNIAPAAPIITSSTPTSPGNSLTPTLSFTGEAGSTLLVYNNAAGTGSPVATTTISAGGVATATVTVISSSTTTFTAKTTDAAGNVSALSSGFTYTHTP